MNHFDSTNQNNPFHIAAAHTTQLNSIELAKVHATSLFSFNFVPQVDIWASIPFAEPPVGDLRFMPPQPKRRWSGERDVSQKYNNL